MKTLKQMLAARTAKKFRWAVLRPKNKALISTPDQIRAAIGKPSEEFQTILNDSLKDGAIFVGYMKPHCRVLFNAEGFSTGRTLEPGDVMDEIEDFNSACESGAYVATGKHIDLSGHELEIAYDARHADSAYKPGD